MSEKDVKCIGIVLDGNRRWAKERGLPKLEGHRQGSETLKEVTKWVRDRGIPHLAVFVFSTENWQREETEVSYLMNLFREFATRDLKELHDEGVRIRFVGQRERLAPDLQDAVNRIEQETAEHSRITLWVCLSYGGRAEIVEAARRASTAGEEITEESFAKHLWTADMPDVDILVRTSGEKRTSGFLTWKSVYAELFFVDAYWPDFSEKILDDILKEFGERERRLGK